MMRVAIAAIVGMLSAAPACAHFLLQSPASWREQDALGSPQKMGPCGDEATAPTTGAVTPYAPGDTITIVLDETIFHPGHYRVALAVHDRSELPPEPPVTPGATECGSVPVEGTPVLPVLADGVLAHDAPFETTQSISVTLPSNVTCAHCTLQVLEFMSSHPAPCFYHHCADLAIGMAPAACTADAGCDDANGCTADRCVAGACRHDATALASVAPGFLGTLALAACVTDRVPASIAVLFDRATRLVGRAAATPARARRLLVRASHTLHGAAARAARANGTRVGDDCGTALETALGLASARVECLRQSLR